MFQPVQPKRAFEEVAEQIKHAILAKKIKYGDRLPSERALAEQFKTGRITIREALRTLETTGFINIRKGSRGGAFIGTGDPEIIPAMIMDNFQLDGITEEQITEARITLELGTVAAAIANGNEDDLGRIARNIEETGNIREEDEPEEIYSRMINFHILIAEASHNLPYVLFTRALAQWSRRQGVRPPSHREHEWWRRSHTKIYEAIEARDIPLAQRLIREDIEQTRILRVKWGQTPKSG